MQTALATSRLEGLVGAALFDELMARHTRSPGRAPSGVVSAELTEARCHQANLGKWNESGRLRQQIARLSAMRAVQRQPKHKVARLGVQIKQKEKRLNNCLAQMARAQRAVTRWEAIAQAQQVLPILDLEALALSQQHSLFGRVPLFVVLDTQPLDTMPTPSHLTTSLLITWREFTHGGTNADAGFNPQLPSPTVHPWKAKTKPLNAQVDYPPRTRLVRGRWSNDMPFKAVHRLPLQAGLPIANIPLDVLGRIKELRRNFRVSIIAQADWVLDTQPLPPVKWFDPLVVVWLPTGKPRNRRWECGVAERFDLLGGEPAPADSRIMEYVV